MCHLLAAYWNLSPTCCMLATDNTEFHLDMHTTVLNCEFWASTLLSKMAEYRFRQPKSVEDEERCVLNAIPKSTRYKNKWAARIFEEWGKARFPKVATLEPGGLFKEYDLHKVQSLEIPLLQMDALSVNYWLTKFVQEVAKPSKERYPPKTIYQIVCGLRRFMEENNEKLDFNPLDASDKRCDFVAVCSTCYYLFWKFN